LVAAATRIVNGLPGKTQGLKKDKNYLEDLAGFLPSESLKAI